MPINNPLKEVFSRRLLQGGEVDPSRDDSKRQTDVLRHCLLQHKGSPELSPAVTVLLPLVQSWSHSQYYPVKKKMVLRDRPSNAWKLMSQLVLELKQTTILYRGWGVGLAFSVLLLPFFNMWSTPLSKCGLESRTLSYYFLSPFPLEVTQGLLEVLQKTHSPSECNCEGANT